MMNEHFTKGSSACAAPFRTIQLHPTRRCNLCCKHCYSSSSPLLKESLDLTALKTFLKYAYDQGFNNISLSGGEPLLYKDLEALLRFTKELGYNNTMATNGMLLGGARNRSLLQYLDLVAVSVDGPPQLHDYIRGQQGAFEKMQQGLQILKELNKPFGLIHTVTPESWKELIWLGAFAADAGAKLLQLHPLELFGRARQELAQWANDDLHLHRTYILANYLSSKYQGRMVIQADLLHRDYLQSFPQVVNGFARSCSNKDRLAQVIDNIVIDETGAITPFAYGFDPQLSIGTLHDFDDTLFDRYLAHNAAKIEAMMEQTLAHVFENKDQDIINWNEVWVYNSRNPLQVSA
ncbi:radical SAM protein [Niabella drilacis]|uniref:4Fe-4S single cluster domain-containing protein n=1 Tax=Niabella drilacis (strain DSM 25811 / CCM 8410 / CCUG 62505 / LMG 26954 / E90) TaxID=1285928 RepID=A0A1G6PPK1_NIADE|nr:radical SAM protein [Niabella drilacis]SDC81305.1 4Fe-4S single cluster domain-containing protein [Niabella drilacis]